MRTTILDLDDTEMTLRLSQGCCDHSGIKICKIADGLRIVTVYLVGCRIDKGGRRDGAP